MAVVGLQSFSEVKRVAAVAALSLMLPSAPVSAGTVALISSNSSPDVARCSGDARDPAELKLIEDRAGVASPLLASLRDSLVKSIEPATPEDPTTRSARVILSAGEHATSIDVVPMLQSEGGGSGGPVSRPLALIAAEAKGNRVVAIAIPLPAGVWPGMAILGAFCIPAVRRRLRRPSF